MKILLRFIFVDSVSFFRSFCVQIVFHLILVGRLGRKLPSSEFLFRFLAQCEISTLLSQVSNWSSSQKKKHQFATCTKEVLFFFLTAVLLLVTLERVCGCHVQLQMKEHLTLFMGGGTPLHFILQKTPLHCILHLTRT